MRRDSSSEEEDRILKAVLTWIIIAYPDAISNLRSDMWHSALLSRLLDGKEPLAQPPPIASSYPWYGLVDNGEGKAATVFEPTWDFTDNKKYLSIEQSFWEIIEKVNNEEYIVRWQDQEELYKVTKSDENYWLVKLFSEVEK